VRKETRRGDPGNKNLSPRRGDGPTGQIVGKRTKKKFVEEKGGEWGQGPHAAKNVFLSQVVKQDNQENAASTGKNIHVLLVIRWRRHWGKARQITKRKKKIVKRGNRTNFVRP